MAVTTPGALRRSFDIENDYDILKVYDGSSTSATLIGEFTGTTSPGTIVATNEEGALTFFFKSDFAANRSGWAATLRCIFDNPITLEVTADPEVINEGESSQLLVVANGGNGNYSYSWEPVETLSNPNIANPVASLFCRPLRFAGGRLLSSAVVRAAFDKSRKIIRRLRYQAGNELRARRKLL